ncbi:FSH1-domain-containing protein [Trametes coccinea BRFM310]|uniref:FSH1-domain-containing protein n=1 Tax=Trametes coccinea (strain BRFM310) TaxID=1353009 RepID=A0A1Y2IEU1_TRAC3|nr:FSH1-domain-containing protein [Trametes coccinea BRFM310]
MAAKKVLMLHGYAQNATIFSKRMGALRKTCGKDIEFVFVDAPHVLTPADLAEAFQSSNESSSLDDLGASEAAATQTDPALAPRGWWSVDAARTKTVGIEDSIMLLRDYLSKDHYEGIFGFSQGAAMAAVVAALLEKPETYPPFLVDGKPPHPPLTFCISAAGFRPHSPLCDAIFLPSYATPTLHILGRNDVIVVEERARTLIDVSSNARVEYHDGGHFVPSKANWRNFLKAYMKDSQGDVPSPSAAPASQPASGAATPVTPAAS